MKLATKSTLTKSLTEVIEHWLDYDSTVDDRPYVGQNAAYIMATAAISVLEGIDDAAEYLKSEGALDPNY